MAPWSSATILVTGALGSVGRSAIFAAKRLGVKVWAGVRRSQGDAQVPSERHVNGRHLDRDRTKLEPQPPRVRVGEAAGEHGDLHRDLARDAALVVGTGEEPAVLGSPRSWVEAARDDLGPAVIECAGGSAHDGDQLEGVVHHGQLAGARAGAD